MFVTGDMFKLPVIVPPALGNLVVSSIVTLAEAVTRPLVSTVKVGTCCADPNDPPALTAAKFKAPVLESVASPDKETPVAMLELFPTKMFADVNEFDTGV